MASTTDESSLVYLPLAGATAAGEVELYADRSYDTVGVKGASKNAKLALRINGDSMEPDIPNGSIITVKPQDTVENGQIAVIEIDGEGTVCKRFCRKPDGTVELRSINPAYPPITEFENLRIIGRVLL